MESTPTRWATRVRCSSRFGTSFKSALLLLGLTQQCEAGPGFYSGIAPILEKRCSGCHSAEGGAPMSLRTYPEVRPWAKAIYEAVRLGRMPPWFADPRFGRFANDPRLPEAEIAAIGDWVRAGAPEGVKPARHSPAKDRSAWAITPDLTVPMPEAFRIPAKSVIDYQYAVLRPGFPADRWVSGVQIRPGDPRAVHHAVLYIRPPDSNWRIGHQPTQEDILAIYTPGVQAARFPAGMGKLIPAGSDLVLQLHYTSRDLDASDRTAVALSFMKERPAKRILTLQMGRDDLRIPPGDSRYKASVSGTLPNDALLLSLFPHMHLRGSGFEFEAFGQGGSAEMLLRVQPYDFFWQLSYALAEPRLLRKGTVLKWTGYFDNSPNNPRNPDPSAEVTWGEQSFEEMMIGFFDVAVDASVDKKDFFVRR